MEGHIEGLLNRLSVVIAAAATICLLHLFYSHSSSCSASAGGHVTSFPSSTCDLPSARDPITPEKRFKKLVSSTAFLKRSHSFAAIFETLRSLGLLSNSSHVLVVAAGAGHEAFALRNSGVAEVTAVDLIDFPPLVQRSDPHNLPYFDGVFDLAFSAGLDSALFPMRFAEEMERTVRDGGAEAVVVAMTDGVEGLFRRSRLVAARKVSLVGELMSLAVLRKDGKPR